MIKDKGAEALAKAFTMNNSIEVLHIGKSKYNDREQ